MSLKELQEVPGIGKVKAIQLKCIAELSKRIAQTGRQQAVVMQNAFSVADYYMEQLRHDVTYYFVDNEFYFAGDKPYNNIYEDVEKFAFFSKAVLEALPVIDLDRRAHV